MTLLKYALLIVGILAIVAIIVLVLKTKGKIREDTPEEHETGFSEKIEGDKKT